MRLQTDPAAESFYGLSPYNSMGNNPVRFSDPYGDDFNPIGAVIGMVAEGATAWAIANRDGDITPAEGAMILASATGGLLIGGFLGDEIVSGVRGFFKDRTINIGSIDLGKGGTQNLDQKIQFAHTKSYSEKWIAEKDIYGIVTGAGTIKVTEHLKIIAQYHGSSGLMDIYRTDIYTSIDINPYGRRSAYKREYRSGVGEGTFDGRSYPLNLVSTKLFEHTNEAEAFRRMHGVSRVQVAAKYQDGIQKTIASALISKVPVGKIGKPGKFVGGAVGTNFMDSWVDPEKVRLDVENLPNYFKLLQKN